MIILGSIGIGYLVNQATGLKKPEVIKEHLILECKRTGRNYDCDPKEKK